MATRIIRFPRAPSEELRELLKPGEFLAPVIALNRFKPESTEGRPWGQPLKKPEGAPLNLR